MFQWLTNLFGNKERPKVPDLIEWGEACMVDHPTIDEQHRELIRIINDVNASLVSKSDRKARSQVFAELIKYTMEHFSMEERLMERHDYPDKVRHKQAHSEFRKKILGFVQDRGHDVDEELLHYLSDWLVQHIKKVDQELSSFLAVKSTE